MRKKLLILFLIPLFLQAQTWTQLSDFPGSGRDDASIFMINQKAYCVSGKSANSCEGDMFVFDCVSENWNSASSLPTGKERQYAGAFSWNGKGYLIGGVDCNNNLLKDFFSYDPQSDSWSVLTDFPGTARHGAHAVVLNDKAFLIGGYNGIFLNEVWVFDLINQTWIQKNNLPFSGFWRGACFLFNGKIHIAFGYTNNNNYNHFIYEYDEVNDSWSALNNFFLPARKYISCAVVSGKVFCYGGQDSSNVITNALSVIDIHAGTITNLAGIPSGARKGGVAFSNGNSFFYTTGFSGSNNRIKETWKHDGVVGMMENEKESEKEHGVFIYPNPAIEKIKILSEQWINKINLIDYKGTVAFTADYDDNEAEIDVSELSSGIYLIQVISNKNPITRKIVLKK